MNRWAIGVDIGGTFTDIVAFNYASQLRHSLKVLTTHDNPAVAVHGGIQQLLAGHAIDVRSIDRVVHATTLFTNALIERRGAPTALIVTRGFRDITEIGNERKYDLYDLQIETVAPLVPRDLRMEIGGRITARGEVLEDIDPREVAATALALQAQGIESIAVCLAHAYCSFAHEQQVEAILRDCVPAINVTLSCAVAPVIREHERISTTVANAYVRPMAAKYLDELQRRVREMGFGKDVLMMLSNGGLIHVEAAKQTPIELLESGPAAGALAAAYHGTNEGFADLLAFDMGGTTAKLCLVEDGKAATTYGFEAARQKRFAEGSGLPILIATTDLIEIGAGGGSIAQVDKLGLLKVGPHSAGSSPGPVCYGLGGQAPTVTDANLVLGYLNPGYFAGGTMAIDKEAAGRAIAGLADRLGCSATDAAWGIHEIVAENMASAARVHVAERGRDPRDFVLLCTGGGGPLHGYEVARKVGVRTIVCPPDAGVASAYGLLIAPARCDRSRSLRFDPASGSLEQLEQAFGDLERDASASLASLQDSFSPVSLTRYADGRFVGQGLNLTFAVPPGPFTGDRAADLRTGLLEAFNAAYTRKFGRTPPSVPVEIVTIRAKAEAPATHAFQCSPAGAGSQARPTEHRSVYFREAGRFVDTPVYHRDALAKGLRLAGPLVIEDMSSSLVVGPAGSVTQSARGSLVININA